MLFNQTAGRLGCDNILLIQSARLRKRTFSYIAIAKPSRSKNLGIWTSPNSGHFLFTKVREGVFGTNGLDTYSSVPIIESSLPFEPVGDVALSLLTNDLGYS
jgi:hypothetical protein